ncbi:MAG: GxxExxY protein [Thermodesulfobacteriota bacterium]|nr:GxxExxY protein [Thermodesulfobacteriota bacterium]
MMTNNTNVIYSDLSYEIMGAIFEVHKTLGPGFVESVYEKALIEEFTKRAIKVETQKVIDVIYRCNL